MIFVLNYFMICSSVFCRNVAVKFNLVFQSDAFYSKIYMNIVSRNIFAFVSKSGVLNVYVFRLLTCPSSSSNIKYR